MGETNLLKILNKKNSIIMISIIIIICLAFSSLFAYFEFFTGKKPSLEDENIEYDLDDCISPLTNQGLILDINRIRHRGLLDKIMKIGISWKNKPSFYVVTEIDGLKYSSNEEFGFTYDVWDTFLQENRFVRDAEEEQETSEIMITIVEKEKKGLLRSHDVEKERIHVTYDYRTGCWVGDDSFKDDDGYGHHVGEFFEVWFNIYQTDFDHDGIPYWTEVNVLHTNPRVDDSNNDPDGDGIPTSWEWKWSYDPLTWDDHMQLDPDIDGMENIEEYQMAKWFADPFSQDIYIEVDCMERGGLLDREHVLYEESQQIIIERFCNHGINVYIDNGWPGLPINGGGELLPHIKTISWDSGMILQFYTNHFADERRGIFRYLLMCHNGVFPMIAFSGNTEFNSYDTMVVGTFIYQMLLMPRTERLLLAATVLHELGHTLSIAPYTIEGCDNISFALDITTIKQFLEGWHNYRSEWDNYKSVMNYRYMIDLNLVDYSDGSHGYNDQNDWENFYLPFFQIENNVICEPGILPPATDKIVDENLSVVLDGWEYSEELTQQYVDNISGWSPIDPIKCNWSVFLQKGDNSFPSDRNLRVYAWPIVPISGWSLIKEGYMNDEKTCS